MDLFNLLARITLDKSAYEKGLGDAEKESKSFGDKLKSGLGGAAKIGAAAIGAVAAGSAALTKTMIDGASEAAVYGDNIDKMSQKMGISAEAYQEWDAIMRHSGTTIDALKPSMKTLATQAEKSSDAFQKLGISQEEVKNLSQEDLFARVISGLQGMEEGTERTYLTSQLLGRGATELGALLNTSAEDTEKMRQKVHELGGVMSDEAVKSAAAYQDSLQDMQTALSGAKRSIMGEFMPSLTAVMDGVSELFTSGSTDKIVEGIGSFVDKIGEVAPKMLEKGGQIVFALASAIVDNLPSLVDSTLSLVNSLTASIIEKMPDFIDSGISMVISIASGIAEALPQLLTSAVDTITSLVDKFVENLPKFIEIAIQIILALANGIQENLPKIIAILPKVIMALVNGLMQLLPELVPVAIQLIITLINGVQQMLPELIPLAVEIIFALINGLLDMLPDLLTAGTQILFGVIDGIIDNLPALLMQAPRVITTIISGLIDALPKLIAFLPQIIKAIVDAFRETDWGKLGGDLLEGLWNGIKNMGEWLKEKIRGLGSAITDALKAVFGIHSPSTVFRDEIGENLALGLGEGFEDEMADVEKRMQKAIPTDFDIAANVNGSVTGSQNAAVASVVQAIMPELYSVIVQALQEGVKIQWKERELARLVKTYAN